MRTSFFISLLFISINSNAQDWLDKFYAKHKNDSTYSSNFYNIQKAFYKYEKHPTENDESEFDAKEEHDAEQYFQFKRWEWFNEQRVYPSGNFPSTRLILDEYKKFVAEKSLQNSLNKNGNNISSGTWINLGATTPPIADWAGMGRVNCMAFMPNNFNTLFIGTACGGVWKSLNGGQSWQVLNTDQLPSLSITSIVIDPTDTNKIYIATGDNFTGFSIGGVQKQGHFCAGIFMSTDGGLTWNLAGMPMNQSQQFIPQQLILNPANTSILLLASNLGIYRSINSGATWSLVRAGFFYSIEFNPLNPNVVYATDKLGLWRSNNNGQSWVYKGGGYPNSSNAGRVSLAVTPADTNYIYVWGPTAGFKKSTNGGSTFVTMTNPDAIAQPYGYVDRAIVVSPTNALNVMVGGLTTAKSIDGGATWNQASDYLNHTLNNWVHADVKKLVYQPGSGTKLYMLNDAGVSVSTDNSLTWTNISNGLQITEIYKVANHPTSADTVYFGAQDEGTNRIHANSASQNLLVPGDGFQPLVDPQNTSVIFTTSQNGAIKKSIDGGVNFVSASPGQMIWNAPLEMNPLNSQTMYAGCAAGLKKSYSGGTQLTYFNLTAAVLINICALGLSKADTQTFYTANLNDIIKSTDGGATWQNIANGLPVSLAGITNITVSSVNPQKVFVCFSGYVPNTKVYITNDGGANWMNYSGSLPNVPVNCMTYQDGSNDLVYIGTDFGVYYRDSTMNDWTLFSNGLPNVIVNDLDIFYPTMKLRAGTYGRGLWETDLISIEIPLASNLLSITGFHIEHTNQNKLMWTTASGSSTNYFEILRRASDGKFYAIGKVYATNNSSSTELYNWIDMQCLAGINYYKLKMVDINGSESFSKTISISSDEKSELKISPNPSSKELTIEYPVKNSGYDLKIFSSQGSEVTARTNSCTSNSNKICIDLSLLSKGIYTVILLEEKSGKIFSSKFLKD